MTNEQERALAIYRGERAMLAEQYHDAKRRRLPIAERRRIRRAIEALDRGSAPLLRRLEEGK